MFDRQQREHRLDDAGRAERVAGVTLGRTARRLRAEHAHHRLILAGVVRRRRGAMQVDVVDIGGGKIRTRKRSEEHTSELQSLMRISYAVFCLKKKKNKE